jgi:hypothetical protein
MKSIILFIALFNSVSVLADFGELDLMTREAIEHEMLLENKVIDFYDDIYDLNGPHKTTDPNCDFETKATLKVDHEKYGEEYKEPLACSVCFIYLDPHKTQADWQDAHCD